MSTPGTTPIAAVLLGCASVLALTACGHNEPASTAASQAEALQNAAARQTVGPDPCQLLAGDEAQKYVGALRTPPFRGDDDGAPQAGGETCVYRGSQGRRLAIRRTGSGTADAGDTISGIRDTLDRTFDQAGHKDLSAMTNRVLAQGPQGPWDKANWIPGGTLFVTAGNDGLNIDVSGASGKQEEAVEIARLAVPRLQHPLAYDGAAGAASAPRPKTPPSDPCALLPVSEVAAAIGPLQGAPQSQDASICIYQVVGAEGPRTYKVAYTWRGGERTFNYWKNGMATVGSAMGMPDLSNATQAMNNMKVDPQTSKMIGGLMNMVGGGGGAPGAASEVGFKTDTTLQGPWDSAMLFHGTQLLAVRDDVMVTIDLMHARYDNAKALLGAICSKL